MLSDSAVKINRIMPLKIRTLFASKSEPSIIEHIQIPRSRGGEEGKSNQNMPRNIDVRRRQILQKPKISGTSSCALSTSEETNLESAYGPCQKTYKKQSVRLPTSVHLTDQTTLSPKHPPQTNLSSNMFSKLAIVATTAFAVLAIASPTPGGGE